MVTRTVTIRSALLCAALVCAALPGRAHGQETATRVEAPPREPGAAPYRASIEYGLTHFSGGAVETPAWHTVTAELSRKMAPVTLVARTNYAHRFGENGVQVEADAYPRLGERFYAYLNAGYSPSDIFPELRYGGELYGGFGKGGEVSLGARRLEFADDAVTIYTGSLGAYVRNYYFSLRPYVTPKDDATSRSLTVLARRYLADEDSHVTFTAGIGAAATESPLPFELTRSSSYRAGLYGKTPLRRRLGARWSVGYEREEIVRGESRDRITVGLGAESRF